jgi:hypothetical protein
MSTDASLPSEDRITAAVEIAFRYGTIDGSHHKMWVIDQMVRTLLGDGYQEWLDSADAEYPWDEGIAP